MMTSEDTDSAALDGVTFRWAAATHCGKVRTINEDSLLARPGVFVVADGMGGHEAGDVASRTAVHRLEELAQRVPIPVSEVAPAIARLNAELHGQSVETHRTGMGTTLVAVLLVDMGDERQLVVFNVGDSRCYLRDDAGFRLVTHDHSLVQELVDAGSINASEAANHPDRNVVTRAVGIESEVSADFVPLARFSRQRLVLCSDGVSGPIDDDRLAELSCRESSPSDVVTSILDEVLKGRAADNATVLVVDVDWEASKPDLDAEITSPHHRLPSRDVEITAPRAEFQRGSFGNDVSASGVIREVPRT